MIQQHEAALEELSVLRQQLGRKILIILTHWLLVFLELSHAENSTLRAGYNKHFICVQVIIYAENSQYSTSSHQMQELIDSIQVCFA